MSEDNSRCTIHMHRITDLELEVLSLQKQIADINRRLVNLGKEVGFDYVVE